MISMSSAGKLPSVGAAAVVVASAEVAGGIDTLDIADEEVEAGVVMIGSVASD